MKRGKRKSPGNMTPIERKAALKVLDAQSLGAKAKTTRMSSYARGYRHGIDYAVRWLRRGPNRPTPNQTKQDPLLGVADAVIRHVLNCAADLLEAHFS